MRPFAAAGLVPCPLLTVSASGGHVLLGGASGGTYEIPDEARTNPWMLRAHYHAAEDCERAAERKGQDEHIQEASNTRAAQACNDHAGCG